MSDNSSDRRHFSRVPFRAQATLSQPTQQLNCRVKDLSLNGLLTEKPPGWTGQVGDVYQIDVVLNQGELCISMDAEVAHIDKDTLGFHCQLIDLDSISHLKRLMELNLGDSGLLQRELSHLIEQHQG
ncbi:MAG: PilZ domain-containing protein [Methylophaga sp.]|nr:PilZ domain-containing protein [Methylophaga sp.]